MNTELLVHETREASRLEEVPISPEIAGLRLEHDPELRAEGLLQWAGRETSQHPEQAAQLYSALLETNEISASVRERAQSRLAALQGEGSIGAQAEILLSRFAREATEPSTLLALTAAGFAYRSTRFFTLGRLAICPQASLLTRGFGARALAGLAGFGVEGLVFPLAGRAGNFALGREQTWNGRALGREIASSYMMLGALRTGGFAAGRLASAGMRPFVQPLGMYGGLLLGHELEVRAGWRAPQALTHSMLESLATLLQFQVAGRLSRSFMGESLQRWEQGIDLRSERLNREWPSFMPLPNGGRLVPVSAGTDFLQSESRSHPLSAESVFMVQGGDGNGKGKDPRRATTLPGLARPSVLPAPNRPPLFLENPYYRIHGLSLRTREIRLLNSGSDIQTRTLKSLEEYFVREKEPVVLLFPESESMDARLQGSLRVDIHRFYREYRLPEDFSLTVLLPAMNTALQFSKNSEGAIRVEPLPIIRRGLARESVTPPKVETLGSRPKRGRDFSELKTSLEGLLKKMNYDSEQNPSLRLDIGRIDRAELASLAEIFDSNLPPVDRRFTILWTEKGGGQVGFRRSGEAIRADWKAYQAEPQTYWYLPTAEGFGHFRLHLEGDYAAYSLQSEATYHRSLDQKLATLWHRLGLPGSYAEAALREEGTERKGTVLARLAQHWLKNAGSKDRTWEPDTLENLEQIHQTLEMALSRLDMGMVSRFQERMGSQQLQLYRNTIEALPFRKGSPNLLPLDDWAPQSPGWPLVPSNPTVKALFVRELFQNLDRPRFPLENYRLLRDPERLGQVYRETLRRRILATLGTIQIARKSNPEGQWTYLLTAEPMQLTENEIKSRHDLEFFLSEISEHAEILRPRANSFHRDFLRQIFSGNRSILNSYLLLQAELEKLPAPIQATRRISSLPSREALEARIIHFR